MGLAVAESPLLQSQGVGPALVVGIVHLVREAGDQDAPAGVRSPGRWSRPRRPRPTRSSPLTACCPRRCGTRCRRPPDVHNEVHRQRHRKCLRGKDNTADIDFVEELEALSLRQLPDGALPVHEAAASVASQPCRQGLKPRVGTQTGQEMTPARRSSVISAGSSPASAEHRVGVLAGMSGAGWRDPAASR